MISLPWHVD